MFDDQGIRDYWFAEMGRIQRQPILDATYYFGETGLQVFLKTLEDPKVDVIKVGFPDETHSVNDE